MCRLLFNSWKFREFRKWLFKHLQPTLLYRRASAWVSCKPSEFPLCWSNASPTASCALNLSAFTPPKLVSLYISKTRCWYWRQLEEVYGVWRRLNQFWPSLSPLPPCPAPEPVDSTRVLVRWQNRFRDRHVGFDHRSAGKEKGNRWEMLHM